MIFIDMNLPIYKLILKNDGDGVEYVALVDDPAIERNFVAFGKEKQCFQIKDEDRRIVMGALMVADMPIYRKDEKRGEYYVMFDKETIEQVVMRFFKTKSTGNVNLMHDRTQIAAGVFLFESMLIDEKRGVTVPYGFERLPDGSWFGSFKVENDNVWADVKSGKYLGFSVEGMFVVEENDDNDLIDNILKVLKEIGEN